MGKDSADRLCHSAHKGPEETRKHLSGPVKKRLGCLPNIITITRFVLTAMFTGTLIGMYCRGSVRMCGWLFIVYALICLSDFFDGTVARGLKAESALGSVLDISADSLFIFSSLVIFNLLGAIPVWFTAVVFLNFFTFLATSLFLVRMKRETARKFLVFDAAGRASAVLFYIIPGTACAVFCCPAYSGIFRTLLGLSAFLSCASMLGRLFKCLAARRP